MTCSVGTTTRRNFGAWFMDMIRCSRLVFTLFSWPEYVVMTYQRNISAPPSDAAVLMGSALDEHVLDESLEDEVTRVQEDADDHAGDQHDHNALDQLRLGGPFDLLELGNRLADEACDASAAGCPRLARRLGPSRGTGSGPGGRRGRPARKGGFAARSHLRPAGTPLRTRLACHLARLPVSGVTSTPAAVFADLEPVGRVPLRLGAHVVPPLALVAGERDFVSYSSGHFSLELEGKRTPRQDPGPREYKV